MDIQVTFKEAFEHNLKVHKVQERYANNGRKNLDKLGIKLWADLLECEYKDLLAVRPVSVSTILLQMRAKETTILKFYATMNILCDHNISVRIFNSLAREYGPHFYLDDFINKSDDELLKIKGIGKKSLDIFHKLREDADLMDKYIKDIVKLRNELRVSEMNLLKEE